MHSKWVIFVDSSCHAPIKLLFLCFFCVCFFVLQVLSVITFKFVPEPVLIKVANHTECRCMEPAIIRRNAQLHRNNGSVQPYPLFFLRFNVCIFLNDLFLAAALKCYNCQKTPEDCVPMAWFGTVPQTDAYLIPQVHQVSAQAWIKATHTWLTTLTPPLLDFPLSSWMPDCEIDVESCNCLPPLAPTRQPRLSHRCQLNSSVCANKHQRFDQVSCRQ